MLKRVRTRYYIPMTQMSTPTLYRCPECRGYFTRATLTFLHFYDDVPCWSDGKNEQWWVGIGGPVGRCPTCSKITWVEDATELMPAPHEPRAIGMVPRLWYLLTGDRRGRLQDERKWSLLPREIKDAGQLIMLSTAMGYVEAIALVPLPLDRETYLRRKLWWASNDHRRVKASSPALEADVARDNMERLLTLIPADTCTLERVELYRQLGRFQEALDMLPSLPADQWRWVQLQRQWATAGDSTMRVIPPQSASARRTRQGAVIW